MLIRIDGIGFANKGAEMMLREIVRRVRAHMAEATLAVPCQSGPYISRAELGLYQMPKYRRYWIEWSPVFRLLPERYRRDLGLVMNNEVDAILDSSGYRYSGHWGPRDMRRLARQAVEARRGGRRVVLLPQAFGPFDSNSRKYLATIVDNVDLIFARDEISYDCITQVVGEHANLRIAPDFTLPFPGLLRPRHEAFRGRFCLIPNRQMLHKTDQATRRAYVPLMRECLRRLLEWDTHPYILIHEPRDERLAQEIVEGLVESVEIVKESDCRAIKGIVAISGGVIASRYHGLVNALGQGVPALGTGWSHKYQMLFRDYGFEQGLIPVPTETTSLHRKLSMLTEPSTRERLIEQFRATAERQRRAIESMWTEVFALLKRS